MNPDHVGGHFDRVAPDCDMWKQKAHRYYDAVEASLRDIVPPGSKVLEVGCATGDILASLAPEVGVGLDISLEMIERASGKHPELRFTVHDLMHGPLDERFDFVVAADVAEHVPDLEYDAFNGRYVDRARTGGRRDREPPVVSGPAPRRVAEAEDAGGRPRVALAGGSGRVRPPRRSAGAIVRSVDDRPEGRAGTPGVRFGRLGGRCETAHGPDPTGRLRVGCHALVRLLARPNRLILES